MFQASISATMRTHFSLRALLIGILIIMPVISIILTVFALVNYSPLALTGRHLVSRFEGLDQISAKINRGSDADRFLEFEAGPTEFFSSHIRQVKKHLVFWRKKPIPWIPPSNTNASEVKVIFFRNFPDYYELKPGPESFSACHKYATCTLTLRPTDQADLVIHYGHRFPNPTSPPSRPPSQIWAYFAVESPVHSNEAVGAPEWRYFFNWTMTYRLDSDVRFGYGIVLTKQQVPSKNSSSVLTSRHNQSHQNNVSMALDSVIMDNPVLWNLVKGKTKMAAAFISNCQDKADRLHFVRLLQEVLQGVDVYGHCGTLKCEKNEASCNVMLERDYFFFLAFENSLCEDYVTEKLYRTLQLNVVPVVRAAADLKALTPPRSVIDTSSFRSILELAHYLQYLRDNPRVYLTYLLWKNHYEVIQPQPMPFCELCLKLHEPQGDYFQAYENVDSWWREGTCYQAQDLHIEDRKKSVIEDVSHREVRS